jgi:cell division septum initiation protein DivIVA
VSRIEQLIDEIEAYIDSCKPQAFSNNRKIIVDKDEMDDLLAELRHRTPEEIKKYQKIISNQEAILSNAKGQAEAMLAEATKQTNELINEHEIIQKAYARAGEIIEQANAQAQQIVDRAASEANALREGSIRYADEMLKSLQTIISHSMESADSKHNAMMASLQSNYDIISANRRELAPEEVLRTEEEEDTPEEES